MGFAAGFQTGAQAVERGIKLREDEQLKQQLAEAYKAPTSGLSYTSDQMERMRQAQTSGAYDIEAVPGAEGQTPTLRYIPKQGLDAGDAAAIRPMEFAPQQVQIYGGQSVAGQFDPVALQGLQARQAARVVGASGDYRGAALLQKEASDLEFQARMRPLQEQSTRLQIERDQAGLGKTKREEAMAVANQTATQEMAELRSQGPITQETISALAKKHGADPTHLLNTELAQYKFTAESLDAESKAIAKQLSKASLGGIPGMNKFLADKFDPNKNDNITPEIVQTKAGYVVMYDGKQLNEYGTHKSLSELVAGVHGMISGDTLGTAKTLAQIRQANAAAAASEAETGLSGAKGDRLRAETGYYNNIKGQNPTLMINDKNETVPVVMSDLPRVGGVVQLPKGLRLPKDVQQATALEQRTYESLTKTDAWQRAERKGDQPEMNRLLLGRGLDPAKHGGAPPVADWQVATGNKATKTSAPAAVAPVQQVGIQYANDEDYRNLPYRNVNQGYGTVDARTLLRTPVYGSGMQGLKVND